MHPIRRSLSKAKVTSLTPSSSSSLVFAVVFLTCLLTSLSGLLSKREITQSVTELPFYDGRATTPEGKEGGGGGEEVGRSNLLISPQTDQVVLVILDALRPDFVFPSLEPFIREGDQSCSRRDLMEESRKIAMAEAYGRRERSRWRREADRASAMRAGHDADASQPSSPLKRPYITSLHDMIFDYPNDTIVSFLIADAPTTTSQRLKAIMTGTIPAFIEGGANFNSDEVIEDSLLLQLSRRRAWVQQRQKEGKEKDKANAKRSTSSPSAVVLGDDTWLTLFNYSFWREATVFPSFDVRDLDGNDKAVMAGMRRVLMKARGGAEGYRGVPVGEHGSRSDDGKEESGDDLGNNGETTPPTEKPPTLAESYLSASSAQMSTSGPAPLVILHFLGIDHAGHSYHAYHGEMERKLNEINAQMKELLALLEERHAMAMANPLKGLPSSTTLIVMGDHGMTNSGDHGGDFSQETDTIALTRVFRRNTSASPQEKRRKPNSTNNSSKASSMALASSFIDLKRAACRLDAHKKRDEHPTCRFEGCVGIVEGAAVTRRGEEEAEARIDGGALACNRVGAAYQIDIVPTLASLLGVGVPFSNMGSVMPEVVGLVGTAGSEDGRPTGEEGVFVLDALKRNRRQIDLYLNGPADVKEKKEADGAAKIAGKYLVDDDVINTAATSVSMDQLAPFLSVDPLKDGSNAITSAASSPQLVSALNHLRAMASIASSVRRSRAQMKEDRIFVGASAALLWCLVWVVRYFYVARCGIRSEDHTVSPRVPTFASDHRVTVLCSLSSKAFPIVLLACVGVGIATDSTLMVVGGCVVSVVGGFVGLVSNSLCTSPSPPFPTSSSLTESLPSSSTLRPAVMLVPLFATFALVIVRIIPPFSNSFVVFEDTIVQWLLCLAVTVACVVIPKMKKEKKTHRNAERGASDDATSSSSLYFFSPAHVAAAGLCGITRVLFLLGVRSRRHHTHTIEAVSRLDSFLLTVWGWDGNLKSQGGGGEAVTSSSPSAVLGSTILDVIYHVRHTVDLTADESYYSRSSSKSLSVSDDGEGRSNSLPLANAPEFSFTWHLNHYAIGQLLIRLCFNLVCVGGLLLFATSATAVSQKAKAQKGRSSLRNHYLSLYPNLLPTFAIALVMTMAEHIPILHHLVGVGGAALFAVVASVSSCSSDGMPRLALAFACVWISTLSTTPSSRLTAALTPLVLRLGVIAVRPLLTAPLDTTAAAADDDDKSGIPSPSSLSSSQQTSRCCYLPPLPPLIFHLIGWCLFFASGQQTVISTLDWGSAFIGVRGFNFILCGALVFVRTFYPFVLSAVVPVVLLWGEARGGDADNNGVEKKGDGLSGFLHGFLLYTTITSASSLLAAGILRMHLMMWAIFCPKMLYDAILWLILACIVGALGRIR